MATCDEMASSGLPPAAAAASADFAVPVHVARWSVAGPVLAQKGVLDSATYGLDSVSTANLHQLQTMDSGGTGPAP